MQAQPWKRTDSRPFEALVTQGQLSRDDFQAALAKVRKGGTDLENLLIDTYHVSADTLRAALSNFHGCPTAPDASHAEADPALLKHLNLDYLKANHWIPLLRDQTSVVVATDDPYDMDRRLDVQRAFPGMTIRFAIGLRRDIRQFLVRASGEAPARTISAILGELKHESQDVEEEHQTARVVRENDSTIVRLANQIICDAYRAGASDIHIEPSSGGKDTAVRFRVDGSCSTYMMIPAHCRRAIVSRVKIMASLDIAERRKPQDGKIKFKLPGAQDIELRVATIPTAGRNEDVVLRILTGKGPMLLEAMDLTEQTLHALTRIAEKPYGIILCVGPTGSGKTTTLHALLRHINTDDRKVWTAEDPIEITQEGLRQVQVQPKIGFTFAAAMRAFLRADPDVIMIGEMRDKETAEIALEASLTGHLVLSTLHTNSAVETVVRLLDMGCDAFNFADAMLGILAKRLCKRLCGGCKEAYHPDREEYETLIQGFGPERWDRLGVVFDDGFTLFRARGCEACNQSGFKGRLGLHELLLGTEEMKGLIHSQARSGTLLKAALSEGMTTLVQDGIEKVLQGETTYGQVRRVAIK